MTNVTIQHGAWGVEPDDRLIGEIRTQVAKK